MNQWVSDKVQHGAESLHRNSGFTYNSPSMRVRLLATGLALILAAPFLRLTVSARQATDVSLIIANGIVITVDGSRRVLNPGSVAVNESTLKRPGMTSAFTRKAGMK